MLAHVDIRRQPTSSRQMVRASCTSKHLALRATTSQVIVPPSNSNKIWQPFPLAHHTAKRQAMDPDPWADAAPSQGTPSQSEDASVTSPTKSTPTATGSSSGARPSRLTPRRLVAQPTRLEVVEDDPLGPLGGGGSGNGTSSDDLPLRESPPEPPQKEQLPIRTTMPQPAAARRGGPADPHRIDSDDDGFAGSSGPRQPPPVQAALPSPVRSSVQPSVSIEQAAKPNFHISVGDPHKVGDLTSSHIVYSVRTKVHSSASYV